MAFSVDSLLQTQDRPSPARRYASSVPHLPRLPDHFALRQDILAAALVLANGAIVVMSGVVAYKLNVWYAYVMAFILVGARGQALNILQHEAMHYLLFTNRTTNVVVGSILSGLIGTRYFDGRTFHMNHHRNVGLPSDPNEVWHSTKGREPVAGAAWFFLSQLVGIRILMLLPRLTALGRQVVSGKKKLPLTSPDLIIAAPQARDRETSSKAITDLACLMLCQLVVLGLTWRLSAFWVYPLLYVAPIVTLTAFFEALRSFSEHVLPGETPTKYPEEHRLFLMHAGPIECFFVSQFSFHYHHLHHLYPNVPTFKMKEVHRWMCNNDPYYRLRYKDRAGFFMTAINYSLGREIDGYGSTQSMEDVK
jgi:fatty acid desaturase